LGTGSKNFNSDKSLAENFTQEDTANPSDEIFPQDEVVLPIEWRDLGKKMVDTGVIDKDKFESIYVNRGGIDTDSQKLLYGENNGKLKINSENASFILNLFWGLGLANKNIILEEEMTDPRYGGQAGNFASTGGWTISKGNPMDHYNNHQFVILTKEQQNLVDKVAKNIYRPCCGNSTHFPDCNHGMAMLGLLELMASQDVNETEMYKVALQVNSYWFPETYLTIAQYLNNKGIKWKDIDPKEILGVNYSSAQGYQRIASQVVEPQSQGGGGCSV